MRNKAIQRARHAEITMCCSGKISEQDTKGKTGRRNGYAIVQLSRKLPSCGHLQQLLPLSMVHLC